MKLTKLLSSAFLLILTLITLCGCSAKMAPIDYTELGIPTTNYFTLGTKPCCPWDLAVFDNKLFVGSGDYDNNAGPIKMFYYDLIEKEWSSAGGANDEEISRFIILDGNLVAPGIDPRENWSFGNYYQYDPQKVHFKKNRNIPGGVHVFDLVKFDDKIIAGLGVENGKFPAAFSTDGGRCFNMLPFHKDGEAIDTSEDDFTRVYDFVVYKNELYAILYRSFFDNTATWEFYKYDNGKFVYYNDMEMFKLKIKRTTHHYINAKAEFNEKMYFAVGGFYSSDDLINYEKIELPNTDCVTDLFVKDDALYVLAFMQNEDGTYKISVHKSEGEGFTEILYFNYDIPVISFEYDGTDFYFGMGIKSAKHELNGMILSAKYE
ncbi:MAG: hypothetical protein J6V93_02375 [Clostridia bacterium]|nr:hypothetical protein [Clostridia bacterium]